MLYRLQRRENPLVEDTRLELVEACLQSRCSSRCANPPDFHNFRCRDVRRLSHPKGSGMPPVSIGHRVVFCFFRCGASVSLDDNRFQKGGVPAAPSGTATLLRLSPNHQFYPRPTLAVTAFRHPRLSWLDGRCVQGPGTYSPRHG